jgi:ATPase subunit of ABC transporter with duplicated ATPase domains
MFVCSPDLNLARLAYVHRGAMSAGSSAASWLNKGAKFRVASPRCLPLGLLACRFWRLEDTGSAAASSAAAAAAAADSDSDSDSEPDSSQWFTSLGQLSGGQQTLVSLAMLLAVARSGNGSSLFLLDEIDAALDEHNQARASALLRQLSHAADGSGCQILCVTHNAAFQSVCDAFVQVVRGPHGSSMPAAAAVDVVPEDGRDRGVAAKKSKGKAAAKGKASGSNSKESRAGKKVRFTTG